MKDSELRDILGRIEQAVKPAESAAFVAWQNMLTLALQRIEKAVKELPPCRARFELPSPRVPMFVGGALGALIFAAGILLGWMLK